MTRFHPQTPLSDLINDRLSELRISRTDVVERMGFANQSKGLRRLDDYLATGQPTSHLLKALPQVLGLNAAEVDAAAAPPR